MTSTRQLLACIVSAVLFCGLASGNALADHHVAKWDQAQVTAIAAKLPKATEALYTALYQEGQTTAMPGAFGAGDDYHEFKDKVRLMHSESMHLASELKKGLGQNETKHAFQRIAELNRDAAEAGRAQFTENPVIAKFSAVEDLIRQLGPYYGS
jgi:hypothetical protein